jgi:2-polyprenyl-6-methoxyphenol hydroxylase-like FAD-dependent oxidoreductase
MSALLVLYFTYSGAGPVGLTLANLLTKYKIPNILIEKDPNISRNFQHHTRTS